MITFSDYLVEGKKPGLEEKYQEMIAAVEEFQKSLIARFAEIEKDEKATRLDIRRIENGTYIINQIMDNHFRKDGELEIVARIADKY